MNRFTALAGRILVAVPFLVFGFAKIVQFQAVGQRLATMKIPMPTIATVIIIIIEALGGLCLVIGFKTRFWAWIIFLYVIPVTFIQHRFWDYAGGQRMDEMAHFLKYIAIMGALLLLAAFGPGSLSVDKA
jgi:putative oxidoreductase